jgi:transcriptional regulator with XRE-family HTH domain
MSFTNFVKVIEQNKIIATISIMPRHPFSILLERKYLEWQIEIGERKPQAEFARLMGVSRASLTMWMNGTHLPDMESAKKIASFLGPEIFDVLGLPHQDPNLQAITNRWDRIPPELQQKLAEDAASYELKNNAQNTEELSKRRKKRTAG